MFQREAQREATFFEPWRLAKPSTSARPEKIHAQTSRLQQVGAFRRWGRRGACFRRPFGHRLALARLSPRGLDGFRNLFAESVAAMLLSCLLMATAAADLLNQLAGDDECLDTDSSLSALQRRARQAPNASACLAGQQIPFSDRGPGNECWASGLGAECDYSCQEGYVKVGRHVCQTIVIEDLSMPP